MAHNTSDDIEYETVGNMLNHSDDGDAAGLQDSNQAHKSSPDRRREEVGADDCQSTDRTAEDQAIDETANVPGIVGNSDVQETVGALPHDQESDDDEYETIGMVNIVSEDDDTNGFQNNGSNLYFYDSASNTYYITVDDTANYQRGLMNNVEDEDVEEEDEEEEDVEEEDGEEDGEEDVDEEDGEEEDSNDVL